MAKGSTRGAGKLAEAQAGLGTRTASETPEERETGRHHGVGTRHRAQRGLGIRTASTPIDSGGSSTPVYQEEQFTNTWELMNAIKYNLMQYRDYEGRYQLGVGSKMNWLVGYILPKTVFPAITVFPMEKIFLPRRSGLVSSVDYRFEIDIYSPWVRDLERAKTYTNRIADDVTTCLKGAVTMPIQGGRKLIYDCKVLNVDISETTDDSKRQFQSRASVTISCMSRHRMNQSAEFFVNKRFSNNEEFLQDVARLVRTSYRGRERIKDWHVLISKPITDSPTVQVLPGNVFVDDTMAGPEDPIERHVTFAVVSRDFPRIEVIQANLTLADEIVHAIEENYMVEGAARNCIIENISYGHSAPTSGFEFMSTVSVLYDCVRQKERILH